MHRFASRTLAVVSLAGLLAAGSLPVAAKPGSKGHGGKKPIGEIVSFDATTSTLVVDLADGDDLSAPVDPEVRVKLDHRGWAGKASRSKGNPTLGSLDDLLPGASVLRLKLDDDTITKIRLRAAPAEAPAPDGEDSGDAAQDTDDTDDSSSDDTDDAEDGDDDSDDENPDDGQSGDPEDALPPLPAP